MTILLRCVLLDLESVQSVYSVSLVFKTLRNFINIVIVYHMNSASEIRNVIARLEQVAAALEGKPTTAST